MATAKKKSKISSKPMNESVKVSACLDFNYDNVPDEGDSEEDYTYGVTKLWFDKGDLVASAGCDDVFVCYKRHIPNLIAFLQKIVDAK